MSCRVLLLATWWGHKVTKTFDKLVQFHVPTNKRGRKEIPSEFWNKLGYGTNEQCFELSHCAVVHCQRQQCPRLCLASVTCKQGSGQPSRPKMTWGRRQTMTNKEEIIMATNSRARLWLVPCKTVRLWVRGSLVLELCITAVVRFPSLCWGRWKGVMSLLCVYVSRERGKK